MKKSILILISSLLLIGFTAATAHSIDLDQETNLNGQNYHYSVMSIPTHDGLSAIETSTLENQCKDLRAVAWDGDSGETDSDTVYSTRGYVFLAPQECDISIDSEDYFDESAPALSEGWNIISTGSSVMFDEAQGELSDCEIPQSDLHTNRKKLYEISLEGSSSVMQMTENLEFSRAYWVEVKEKCEIIQDSGDSEDSIVSPPEDDGGEEEDEEKKADFTSGEFSFFDTEAGDSGSTRVSTENSNFQYDMYDGDIVGRMRYQNVDGGLHTFWVKNEHTEESDRESGNSDYLSIPQDGEETWGTEESGPEESGLYEMDDTGCTDFQVAVLPDQTSELDEALQGPETFTFCPGDGRSDDDTESAPSKTSGDYTFRLSPRPQDITTGTDVTLEAEGDLEDKRVRLELDGIAGYVPNDPERYRECTGSPCSITIEEDRIEGEPNTVRGKVRSYDPINLWEDEAKVSWSID